MSAASSFRDATRRFNNQAAALRRELAEATIQRRTVAGADVGVPLCVGLSPVRTERELTEAGFVLVKKSTLTVPKTSTWTPQAGEEFYRASTAQLFRIASTIGSDSAIAGEIVCEAVVITA